MELKAEGERSVRKKAIIVVQRRDDVSWIRVVAMMVKIS